jgi:predicted amino acid-binding ACT domain protein
MKFLGAVLIGVVAAVSGLVLNLDRPFLMNQSHISQAVAAETLQVNSIAEFTQKDLSKKPFRSLLNMFKSEPWRLSRHSR